jgi:uncharacterized protein YycO
MLLIQLHTGGTGLFARLIRWFSRSDVHHVSLWRWDATDVRGGEIVEAMEGYGVRRLPADAYAAARAAGRIRCLSFREPLSPAETATLWAAASAEIGRGYDWLGVIRFVSRRRQDGHPQKWFCSELVAAACTAAGRPLFHAKPAWQVLPADLAYSLALVPTDAPDGDAP